jgi:glycosyltransferase involved in cell wall biosynthesis/GR25 family glycosyltransferase involved in LPS biosynthesis
MSVCLAMIVRDAAPFVTETLSSVARFVDHWVVVDTGSSDRTAEVVTAFFADAGIPGELFHREWVGFAHNRTEALALARGRADWALMVDADDLVAGDLPVAALDDGVDGYRLRFGTDFVYWRTGLFRLDRHWEFRGVVHEHAVCLDDGARTENLDGPYHLVFRSLGGRGKDPQRFRRDIEALLASWADDPDPRTAFYLAQSYRDAGELQDATLWYRRRAGMTGWDEETFVAALEYARCLQRSGADDAEVVAAYEAAHRVRPTRSEALCDLARLHRLGERWQQARDAAMRGASIPFPEHDLLFVDAGAYRWRLADERAISAHYLGLHDEAVAHCEALLASPHLPEHERERILANRDTSLPHVRGRHLVHRPDLVAALGARPARPAPQVTLTITTCRRRALFERTVDSFLSCCTDHDRIDRWICIDDGSDDADRDAMRARYPFFEFVMKPPEQRGHATSMNELASMVASPYWLHLEDDWDFVSPGPWVQRTIEILEDDPGLMQVVLNRNYAETLEHRNLVGGEPAATSTGTLAYRRHVRLDPEQLDALFAANPGRRTNAYWPGFSLMPSMLRTAAVAAVGAFDPGAGHFERDFAERAERAGWRVAFLDTIVAVTTGRLRNDVGADAPPNAYELNDVEQFAEHDTITVGVMPNWTSPGELVRQWRRQFPAGGAWRGVRLVDPDEAGVVPDYWAVVNHVPSGMVPPPAERTIVLQMEPSEGTPELGEWTDADARSFVQLRTHDRFPNTVEWHLAATYDELAVTPIVKSRDLSAVVSSKRWSVGHHLRLDFVHALEAAGVPIDVYGFDNAEGFAGYVGPLPAMDKRDGLMPYRYTIAVENNAEPNYFTEKVVDAVLSETLCFYWGCPNLEDHIDGEAFIRLPLGDVPAALRIVREAIAANEFERRLPAIRRAKRRLLDDQQLAPMLARVVHGARLADSLDIHVINLERRPDRLARFRSGLVEATGARFADRCRHVEAFDGRELELTDEILHLFRGSALPLRSAETACAISHLALWWQVATGDGRPALIFEDDAQPVEGFTGKLVEVLGRLTDRGATADLVLLGLHHRHEGDAPTARHQLLTRLDRRHVMGGLFGYVITQRGARRLWELADNEGIPVGIDTFVLHHAARGTIDVRQALPALVTSPVARHDGRTIDSDIQYDAGRL